MVRKWRNYATLLKDYASDLNTVRDGIGRDVVGAEVMRPAGSRGCIIGLPGGRVSEQRKGPLGELEDPDGLALSLKRASIESSEKSASAGRGDRGYDGDAGPLLPGRP